MWEYVQYRRFCRKDVNIESKQKEHEPVEGNFTSVPATHVDTYKHVSKTNENSDNEYIFIYQTTISNKTL